MRLVRIDERVTSRTPIRLHHLTDLHVGAADFEEKLFRKRVDLIHQDPHARWTHGGDAGELIRHNDRRYETSNLTSRYRQATDIRLATIEHLCELLEPIKHKLWAWCDGNHEAKVDKEFGGHFGVEMCCNLGQADKYVDYRGLVSVICSLTKTQRVRQLIDIQHGWQAGRLKGAPLVQAERELGSTMADIVLRGHSHQPFEHTFLSLDTSNTVTEIVERHRTVLNGGTWRRGYRHDLSPIDPDRISEVEKSTWAEKRGYRPEPVGGGVLSIHFQLGHGRRLPGNKSKVSSGASSQVRHSTISSTYVTAETLGL